MESLAGAADHRHAALPAQRRDPPLRRVAQQHLRPSRPRRHPGRRPRNRGAQRAAQYLPDLLALSASLAVRRGLLHTPPLGALADLHEDVPACGVPDAYADWAEYEASPLPLRDRIGDGAHAALVERSPASRLSDRRDPHLRRRSPRLEEAVSLSALHLRAHRRSRAPWTRVSRCATQPHRLIEENFWRAIRSGLAGELLDLERTAERRKRPARAALEELVAWVLARRGGARDRCRISRCPRANAARAPDGPARGGASLPEIYAEQVARDPRRRRWRRHVASPEDEERAAQELAEELEAAPRRGQCHPDARDRLAIGYARPRAHSHETKDVAGSRSRRGSPSTRCARSPGARDDGASPSSCATSTRRSRTSSSPMRALRPRRPHGGGDHRPQTEPGE